MLARVAAMLAARQAMPAVDMRSRAAVFPTQWLAVALVAFTAAAWVEAVASTVVAAASAAADTAVAVDTGKV